MDKKNESHSAKTSKSYKRVANKTEKTKPVAGIVSSKSKGIFCEKIPTKNGTKPPIRP